MKIKNKSLFKQRMIGLAMIIISIIAPLVDGDGTASLLIGPLGLYTFFTKHYILD